MANQGSRTVGVNVIGGFAAFFVAAYGLRAMSDVFMPLVVALFLAMIGIAPLNWLIRRKVPRGMAVVVVFLFVMFGFLGVGFFLANAVSSFVEVVPSYKGKLDGLSDSLVHTLAHIGLKKPPKEFLDGIEPSSVVDMFTVAMGSLVSVLSQSLVVAFYLVFLLLEASRFRQKLVSAMGPKADTSTIDQIVIDAQNYVGIKTGINFIWGLLVWIVAMLFGLSFSGLWGLVTFLFCFVPVLGPIASLLPPALFAFVDLGTVHALFLILSLITVHVVVGNVLEPLFIGKHLDLSPLVAFFAISFWGWIWGLVGMLLSVPLTMILKLCLEHTKDLRWLSVLIGSSPRENQ